MRRLLIHNARLVDRDTDRRNASLLIEGKRIAGFPTAAAARRMLSDGGVEGYDAGGRVVMPGFIDLHAHFRDPGQTQKEDIGSGSRAAAAGGFTTVNLMPNTSPVVSSAEEAAENRAKGRRCGLVDVIQAVSITRGFDGATLSHLAGLRPADVPLITEDGREVADSAVMLEAMRVAAKKGLVVGCHCEDPFLAAAAKPLRSRALELLSRNGGTPSPAQKKEALSLLERANGLLLLAEDAATLRNIRLAEAAGCRLHLCHVSTARCVEAVAEARRRGIPITFEVTPHHIGLSDCARTRRHIVNPPLRGESDRDALIAALLSGEADAIATDHAPHTAADKAGGAPGFSGLETAFATVHTTLCLGHGMTLRRLSELMSASPARILGLSDRGLLAEGLRADLAVVDPGAVWTVRGGRFESRGKYTPLEGKKLSGRVCATFLSGAPTFGADTGGVR